MSPSSNALFPPKTGSATGQTDSRETTGTGSSPSSPFGNKTGDNPFSSRFAAPTLKPAGTPPPASQPGALGNPFSRPSLSPAPASPLDKGTTSPSPFSKPATSSPLAGRTAETPASSPFSRPAGTPGTTSPSSPFSRPAAGTTGTPPGSAFGKPALTAPPAFGAQKDSKTGTVTATSPLSSRLGQQPSFRPASLLKKDAAGEASSPFRSTTNALDSKAPTRGSLFRPSGENAGTGLSGGLSGFRSQTPGAASTATTPFRKDLQITDEEFIQLRDFIYQQCGIFIAENRKYLVENRLSNRIKELNLKSYSEYYNFLRFDAGRRDELNKLFEVVTTNETSFFRNPPQLKVFQEYVLGEVIAACRQSGKKRIRIWSAGCSTGEEPYTLAIILHEVLKNEISSWDIKITANDLSEAVLAAARRGVYNEYSLRTTPPEIVRTYFTKEGTSYKINPSPKRLVSFGQINLSDREQLRRVEKSQIVFCRNVIIYFDDEMKRKVIGAFYDNLEPNGMLLIGHSESLHSISRAFKPEHHTGTIVYRKLS